MIYNARKSLVRVFREKHRKIKFTISGKVGSLDNLEMEDDDK